jgi:hypothetical protein
MEVRGRPKPAPHFASQLCANAFQLREKHFLFTFADIGDEWAVPHFIAAGNSSTQLTFHGVNDPRS